MTIGRAGQAQPRKGVQPHAQRVRPCLIFINGGKARTHKTMTVKDLVALANAGFSAAQIAAINTAMSAEAQAPAQTPPPAQTATPAQTPPSAPAQPATPAPDQTAEILKQLGIISGQISAANIGNTQQPAQQTADDILAAIIAPPAKE